MTSVDEAVAYAGNTGIQPEDTLSFAFGRSRLGTSYEFVKRAFDITVSLILIPVLALIVLAVWIANRRMNPGPVFFVQQRMGVDCQPFSAYKLRTMRPVPAVVRMANDPLELDRIPPLGAFLRKSRLDELPQIINVLKGDMSLIGPRPDFYDHALIYLEQIPCYRRRHLVRPGISGLAQTQVGYVQSIRETRRKVSADLYYLRNASLRMDAWIVWRTLCTVFCRAGS